MDSLLPFLYFLTPCWGEPLTSQNTFEMLHHSLSKTVEVTVSHGGQVGRVRVSKGVEAIDDRGNRLGVLVEYLVNASQHPQPGVPTMFCPFFLSALTGSNLSSTTHSPSSCPSRNLIFRMKSPSGRAARSLAALPSVIRASKAIRPAQASIPSAISMSPVSSGLLLQTAAAPSTSNSSLGSFRISHHGSPAESPTG